MYIKSKYLFLCLFAFLGMGNVLGQQLVKGLVLEETAKGGFSPVPFANVGWMGTSEGTVTDSSGVFKIARKAGAKFLVVTFVGYRPDTLEVSDANVANVRVILKNADQTLSEVEVTGEREATFVDYLNPIKTQIMTEKELFKAACCNLSESFETNPSVDVNFADAVTGVKQVQMLGLAGAYAQITTENLIGARGLASYYGLGFVPGSWIESIQVTKGIGSVANGYESVSGQINVELRKPYNSDRLFFNAYQNNFGRSEGNLNLSQVFGKSRKFASTLLAHYNNAWMMMDMNKDGFKDMPTGRQFNIINRWHYENYKGFSAQLGVKALNDKRLGGQHHYEPLTDKFQSKIYGLEINTERYEAFGKAGYVFAGKKYKSVGLMASVVKHDQDSYFGNTVYVGHNQTAYANLIYQSIIGSTIHKFRTGLSYLDDSYQEKFQNTAYDRREQALGAFYEHTYTPNEKLSMVLGLRVDKHNLFGLFATPRFHAKYQATDDLSFRASAGRGLRAANIFAENTSVFVSSRQTRILGEPGGKVYGLNPETAWNAGINMMYEFMLAGKAGSLSLDYYRTDFQNQIVTDRETFGTVSFYNLKGRSFSNSFQAELNYELIKKLEFRAAYRLFDVRSDYNGKLLAVPFISKHRAFANLGYSPGQWKFDFTINWNGPKRIPNVVLFPETTEPNLSPSYIVMNAQVSRSLGKTLDLYLGAENLGDFRQKDLVLGANNPFSSNFDASLVWGPVIGRMLYGGLRFRIK